MNFGLAREIYGMQPWCMDQVSMPIYLAILENIQNGVALESQETKCNSLGYISTSSRNKIITDTAQLNSSDKFKGIGVIQLNGPITVNGGASSYGMNYLSTEILKMSKDDRIISFIILANSGGGTSAAIEVMGDAILEVKKKKPVYGLVKKGGMATSACYGILTACNYIWSESQMSIVGSIGTMIQFEGRKANSQSPNGLKHIRLYATASTKKNIEFEEALNNDNYKLIEEKFLKPINNNFVKMVLNNRPKLKGSEFDNGHTVFSKDAIGTFIDGIKSFKEVVNITLGADSVKHIKSSNNIKNNVMNTEDLNIEQIRKNHPDTYNSIFNSGVAAERKRMSEWLTSGKSKWEIRDGFKSGLSVANFENNEVQEFYQSVDEKLKDNGIITNNTKPKEQQKDFYSELEANEFYREVDEMLKRK